VTRPGRLAAIMLRAESLDQDWMRRIPEDPAERRLYLPWMPFNIHHFRNLLEEAIPSAVDIAGDNPRYLEIGCGPGSKLLIARDWCGLDAHGIERSGEMAAAARSLGLDAETADALGWKGYGDYDLIWFNKPFRDPGLEAELEQQVWEDMAPGAVVICANLERPPPFVTALDDWEARRGIWVKPLAAP
jgi:trans-aconitate methyltransferase